MFFLVSKSDLVTYLFESFDSFYFFFQANALIFFVDMTNNLINEFAQTYFYSWPATVFPHFTVWKFQTPTKYLVTYLVCCVQLLQAPTDSQVTKLTVKYSKMLPKIIKYFGSLKLVMVWVYTLEISQCHKSGLFPLR